MDDLPTIEHLCALRPPRRAPWRGAELRKAGAAAVFDVGAAAARVAAEGPRFDAAAWKYRLPPEPDPRWVPFPEGAAPLRVHFPSDGGPGPADRVVVVRALPGDTVQQLKKKVLEAAFPRDDDDDAADGGASPGERARPRAQGAIHHNNTALVIGDTRDGRDGRHCLNQSKLSSYMYPSAADGALRARLIFKRCEPRPTRVDEQTCFGAQDARPLAVGAIIVAVGAYQATKTQEMSMLPGENFQVKQLKRIGARDWAKIRRIDGDASAGDDEGDGAPRAVEEVLLARPKTDLELEEEARQRAEAERAKAAAEALVTGWAPCDLMRRSYPNRQFVLHITVAAASALRSAELQLTAKLGDTVLLVKQRAQERMKQLGAQPPPGASQLEKEVAREGIAPERQKLLLDGRELKDHVVLASLPGVQRYGWLLILQNQATAAEDAAKSWRDAMNAPIAPRTLEGDPGE